MVTSHVGLKLIEGTDGESSTTSRTSGVSLVSDPIYKAISMELMSAVELGDDGSVSHQFKAEAAVVALGIRK